MSPDPQLRAAVRRATLASRGVSRRRLLQGAGLGALAVGAPGLIGCGTEGAQQSADECKSTDRSDEEKTISWSNWPLYIDQARQQGDKVYPTLAAFEELLTRSDLKGKVTLLSEMPDTMLFLLLMEGADPEDFTADEFGAAIDRLQQVVDAGQIRAFTGNEYAQDLVKGNIVACEAWSGDVIQLQFDNPDIKFVAPEEGLSLWSDNMIVPNKAEHKTNAEKLMNYYYDPKVAAEVAAWVNYICPVEGAQEEMTKIDPSLAENPLIFPTDELMANTYDFMALDQKTEQEYQQQFAAVVEG